MMNAAAFTHVLAALAYSALGYSLVRSRPALRVLGAAWLGLFAAVVASAAWGLASVVTALIGGAQEASIAIVGTLLDLARYAAWFAFLLVSLRAVEQGPLVRSVLQLAGVAVTVYALGALTLVGVFDAVSTHKLAQHLALAWLALPVLGLVLVEQVFRSVNPDDRWNAKPLCMGLASIFLFDVYLYSEAALFTRFDLDAHAARGAVHALAAALLYVATTRLAGRGKSLQLSRTVAFHTAALLIIGTYLMLLSGVGFYLRHWDEDWGGAIRLILLCVGLVGLATLAFSGTLRAKLRVLVGKNFFHYRYDYRSEWLRFTARLSAAGSPQEVGVLAVQALAEMLNSPSGALWYRAADDTQFVQSARWNSAHSGAVEPADSSFAHYIGGHEWVVDLNEVRAGPQRFAELGTPAWLLADATRWLVVPLIVGERLTGFVVIDRPHAMIRLDWEVRDLLKTAGRQAAGYLELMHANDALLEARKFDAFNKMSAFVVHDLKNVVAQLALMMQNATRLKDNVEFQQDMLATVENALAKMRGLMQQLRSGETPVQPPAGVALVGLVERIGAAVEARGRAIDVRVAHGVMVRGHADRVERVLGHLVDNALDATETSGTVSLVLEREGRHAKITIHDTGPGMNSEFVNSRLFKPFHSTKADGMGIGSYESRRYVVELGGSMAVDSEVGQGTSITVRLPLVDTVHGELEAGSSE